SERDLLAEQIRRAQHAAAERSIDSRELAGDEWIDSGRLAVRARDVEQVHRPRRSVGGAVTEDAQLRLGGQDGTRKGRFAWLDWLLEVHEVEQLAAPERPAEVGAPLVQLQFVLRQPADRIEP